MQSDVRRGAGNNHAVGTFSSGSMFERIKHPVESDPQKMCTAYCMGVHIAAGLVLSNVVSTIWEYRHRRRFARGKRPHLDYSIEHGQDRSWLNVLLVSLKYVSDQALAVVRSVATAETLNGP